MSELPSDAVDDYALGRSEAETRRLIVQHQLYGPFTRQFLAGAGVTAGMKVLDVGSGAGDVALLVAQLVGPQGEVVGVDMNPGILEVALLRRAAGWLRPGGVVAFQEIDLSIPPRAYPAGPLHEQVARWTTPPPGAPGPDPVMGLKLFTTFLQAGLAAPQLRRDVPVGGGPGWPGYGYVAGTVRSLLPFLERMGMVRADDVDVDTLEDRLRAEVAGQDGIQLLPAVMGAWART